MRTNSIITKWILVYRNQPLSKVKEHKSGTKDKKSTYDNSNKKYEREIYNLHEKALKYATEVHKRQMNGKAYRVLESVNSIINDMNSW